MGIDTTTWLRGLPVLAGAAPDLLEGDWSCDPGEQFLSWIRLAADSGVTEPHVAVLSTVDHEGLPDARALIVRDVDEQGWAFAGPASSTKGTQLAAHPVAALTFWWQPLVRSVRVRGRVVDASAADSAADLAARSAAAQGDVGSGGWQLWRLLPERVEFWQGEVDRRHFRIVYSRSSGDDATWSLSATRGGGPISVESP